MYFCQVLGLLLSSEVLKVVYITKALSSSKQVPEKYLTSYLNILSNSVYNTSLNIVSIMKQIITSSISINISEDFISESDIVSDRHINYKIKKKKYYIQMLITDEEESA